MTKDITPDFLVLGAARSATTFLFQCLKAHPEIFLPDKKELKFFTVNYEKGLEWYQSHFNNYDSEKRVGEVSSLYFGSASPSPVDHLVPKRIHKHAPNADLLFSLRNPIERAYSIYGLQRRKGLHSLGFEEALDQHYLEYVEQGFYFEQLQRFLKYFTKDQMLILIYEDLKRTPVSFIQKIYKFLDVDSDFVPPRANQRRNRGLVYTEDKVAQLFGQVSNTLLRVKVLRPVANFLKKLKVIDRLLERWIFSRSSSDMKPVTRHKLRRIFREQNEDLSKFLNRNILDEWR